MSLFRILSVSPHRNRRHPHVLWTCLGPVEKIDGFCIYTEARLHGLYPTMAQHVKDVIKVIKEIKLTIGRNPTG